MKKYLVSLILLATIAGCTKSQPDYNIVDHKIILDYIASHHLTAKSTASGLYYVIDTLGSSSHPTVYSTVMINYTGRLANDTIFESTVGGNPGVLPLTSAIRGWQEGIPLFGRGGKGTLLIPSSLGYGGVQQVGIPAHSVLIFNVNLIDFY
jgi:FKBP-type peptidyl-prolyl cis-trans isomerase FkpA